MTDPHFQITIKHACDRLGAMILLILTAPLFLVLGIAIKLEDAGPVFFRQRRVGKNEVPFSIWKFRTMYVDADALLNADGRVETNRITRIGRFLRGLSLDELPQLINILKGEMSFIGPRPVLPDHVLRYTAQQKLRFRMKPGITGLAQVNGRNQLLWSKRLAYDVTYVETYSLWLDFRILLKTIRVVFLREGFVPDRNPEQVDDLPPV